MVRDETGLKTLQEHMRQLGRLDEHLSRQFAPILEAQKSLERSLQPIADLRCAISCKHEPFLKEQEKLREMLDAVNPPSYNLPDLFPAIDQIRRFQQSFINVIGPAFAELQRSFEELPPKIRQALMLLASHGWYLDADMPLEELWDLREALLAGEISVAEDVLVEYFDNQIKIIESEIVKQFPHRAHIISSAFRAHADEEYCLSIPVFLSQTDGICKERVGQYLFVKQNKKPQTAIYVERLAADTYEAALLSPLATTTPISASEGERNANVDFLNRHTVLHGESLSYGTKINSLKAVSLINYVSQSLMRNENCS
jgi:hypothetical protein